MLPSYPVSEHSSIGVIENGSVGSATAFGKVVLMDARRIVVLKCGKVAGELTGDGRRAKVEAFKHHRHDIALS